MNNPEFEADILKSIDKSGYSEKQAAKQVDTKGTVRQQIKQVNSVKTMQQSGIVAFDKKKKKSEVIFKR